jgi:hypothetical protein
MKSLQLLGLMFGISAMPVFATEVSIDTRAAHAMLDALQNSRLTRTEAERVARMPENQGPIRKLHEFKVNVTEEDLANALYATAHGEPVSKPEEKAFMLDWVKPKIPLLQALLFKIESKPDEFQRMIEKRITAYTPPGASIKLNGYVVAAGDGAGYAFGGTDFYLNLVMVDDFVMAKSVTTHELYHAVQGAFATYREPVAQADDTSTACRAVQHLFVNIYDEGSAVEVADVSLLAQFSTPNGLRQKNDMEDGAKHLATSASLLEMSVASLEATKAVPYDEVYDVGFYGHAILYNVAYAMAHAIAENDGAAGLAAFARRPPSEFIRRYTELPSYGKDKQHPALGRNTLAALDLVGKGCP